MEVEEKAEVEEKVKVDREEEDLANLKNEPKPENNKQEESPEHPQA